LPTVAHDYSSARRAADLSLKPEQLAAPACDGGDSARCG
jgi:hypothetical protein